MYSKRIRPTVRPAGSSVHESESESVLFDAQATSEIPELSHGIQDRRPGHSKHPSLLAMPAVFSAFSIALVGRFPKLTPVRSQTTRPWLSTLEAGDTAACCATAHRCATIVLAASHAVAATTAGITVASLVCGACWYHCGVEGVVGLYTELMSKINNK